jgi:aldehyde:ferredoxin oxidoreductase
VADYYVLANRLGLDTFEFGRMNKFLEEMFQSGNIKTQPELPLDKFGSREFIQALLNSIAYRRGVGDLLAEGCARAADHLKNGWEFCSKYFPAYGAAKHESVRDYPGVALLWALDSRDPIIDHHPYFYLSVKYQDYPDPFRLSRKDARAISRKILGSDMAIDHSTYQYKPEAVVYMQNRSAVINILVVCDWVYPIIQSQTTEDRMGDTSLESQLLAAVTGHHLAERELDQVGEKVWNLSRAFMAREGRTREEDISLILGSETAKRRSPNQISKGPRRDIINCADGTRRGGGQPRKNSNDWASLILLMICGTKIY